VRPRGKGVIVVDALINLRCSVLLKAATEKLK